MTRQTRRRFMEINTAYHNNYAKIKLECKNRFDDWFSSDEYHPTDVQKQISEIINDVISKIKGQNYYYDEMFRMAMVLRLIHLLEEILDEFLMNYYLTNKRFEK